MTYSSIIRYISIRGLPRTHLHNLGMKLCILLDSNHCLLKPSKIVYTIPVLRYRASTDSSLTFTIDIFLLEITSPLRASIPLSSELQTQPLPTTLVRVSMSFKVKKRIFLIQTRQLLVAHPRRTFYSLSDDHFHTESSDHYNRLTSLLDLSILQSSKYHTITLKI